MAGLFHGVPNVCRSIPNLSKTYLILRSRNRLGAGSRGDAAAVSMIHHRPELKVSERLSQDIGKVCSNDSRILDGVREIEEHLLMLDSLLGG